VPAAKIIVHVNRARIDSNRKHGFNDKVLSCKLGRSGSPDYGHEVDIFDKEGNKIGAIVHRPKRPLPCGARVWIELDPKFVDVKVREDK